MRSSMFREMLDKRLEAVYAVAVMDGMNRYILDDTFVFRLSDGRMYQLLVSQVDKTLREMRDEADVVLWGEYEPELQIVLEAIEVDSVPPGGGLFIGEIREYWANDGKHEFLMGVVLADPGSRNELHILTGGTEAEIVTPDLFMAVIQETGFPCRVARSVHPPSTEG